MQVQKGADNPPTVELKANDLTVTQSATTPTSITIVFDCDPTVNVKYQWFNTESIANMPYIGAASSTLSGWTSAQTQSSAAVPGGSIINITNNLPTTTKYLYVVALDSSNNVETGGFAQIIPAQYASGLTVTWTSSDYLHAYLTVSRNSGTGSLSTVYYNYLNTQPYVGMNVSGWKSTTVSNGEAVIDLPEGEVYLIQLVTANANLEVTSGADNNINQRTVKLLPTVMTVQQSVTTDTTVTILLGCQSGTMVGYYYSTLSSGVMPYAGDSLPSGWSTTATQSSIAGTYISISPPDATKYLYVVTLDNQNKIVDGGSTEVVPQAPYASGLTVTWISSDYEHAYLTVSSTGGETLVGVYYNYLGISPRVGTVISTLDGWTYASVNDGQAIIGLPPGSVHTVQVVTVNASMQVQKGADNPPTVELKANDLTVTKSGTLNNKVQVHLTCDSGVWVAYYYSVDINDAVMPYIGDAPPSGWILEQTQSSSLLPSGESIISISPPSSSRYLYVVTLNNAKTQVELGGYTLTVIDPIPANDITITQINGIVRIQLSPYASVEVVNKIYYKYTNSIPYIGTNVDSTWSNTELIKSMGLASAQIDPPPQSGDMVQVVIVNNDSDKIIVGGGSASIKKYVRGLQLIQDSAVSSSTTKVQVLNAATTDNLWYKYQNLPPYIGDIITTDTGWFQCSTQIIGTDVVAIVDFPSSSSRNTIQIVARNISQEAIKGGSQTITIPQAQGLTISRGSVSALSVTVAIIGASNCYAAYKYNADSVPFVGTTTSALTDDGWTLGSGVNITSDGKLSVTYPPDGRGTLYVVTLQDNKVYKGGSGTIAVPASGLGVWQVAGSTTTTVTRIGLSDYGTATQVRYKYNTTMPDIGDSLDSTWLTSGLIAANEVQVSLNFSGIGATIYVVTLDNNSKVLKGGSCYIARNPV